MAEKLVSQQHEHFEALTTPEHLALPTAEQAEPLRPGETDPRQRLEAARELINEQIPTDNPLERIKAAEEAEKTPQPSHINRELKGITLRRELKDLRRHLPATQRTLSRVIHQPVIRTVSEAASGTVSRPSGLLGGGLVALIGTSSYLYMAKHLGFTYNYGIFLLLFAIGFAVGLILELLVHMATASRRHNL